MTIQILALIVALSIFGGYLVHLYRDFNKSWNGSKEQQLAIFIKECNEGEKLYRREQRKHR